MKALNAIGKLSLFLSLLLVAAPPAVLRAAASPDEDEKKEAEEKDDEKDDEEDEEKDAWFAVVGGDVHTGTGAVLRDATVLAKNGTIEEIGYEVHLPEDHNLSNKVRV